MRRQLTALVILAAIASAAAPHAAERRGITQKDLFAFVWVADPQISPDGTRVAFVRVTADAKKDQYDTAIWLALTDGSQPPRAFTAGQRDTSPRWSPDGRSLVFTRVTDKDGKPQPPQLFLMTLGGGEPRAITDLPKGAANPVWSPDGSTIAFSSSTKPADLAATPPTAKPEDAPHQSDVRVVTEAVYRANGVGGSGFVDSDRPSQIWTVAVPAGSAPPDRAKPVTTGEFGANGQRWSHDGSQNPLRRRPAARVVLLSRRQRPLRSVARRRRAVEGRQHRRIDWRLRALAGREAARFRRHAARPARALLQPARSLGPGSPRRHAEEPDRGLRLRRQRQRRRGPARAARPAARRAGLERRRPQPSRQDRRAGQREPRARRRGQRPGDRAHHAAARRLSATPPMPPRRGSPWFDRRRWSSATSR